MCSILSSVIVHLNISLFTYLSLIHICIVIFIIIIFFYYYWNILFYVYFILACFFRFYIPLHIYHPLLTLACDYYNKHSFQGRLNPCDEAVDTLQTHNCPLPMLKSVHRRSTLFLLSAVSRMLSSPGVSRRPSLLWASYSRICILLFRCFPVLVFAFLRPYNPPIILT